MKILLDANVIISGFVSRGHTFDVIKDAIFRHEVYYTDHLLKEVKDNLSKKFHLSNEAIGDILNTVKKHLNKGEMADAVENVCRDSDDNQVLADAVTNEIELLITGDKDLLVLKNYNGIKIIPPKDYWKLQV